MTPQDREPFAKILLGFAELKGRKLSAPAVELFWQAMQGWTIAEFSAAAQELLRRCEFFPTPYDFEQLRKAGRPTSGEAFATAVAYVRHGAYRNGPHADETIERAVAALGGWRVIAISDEDGLRYLERRFAEHYEAIGDAQATRERLPELTNSSGSGPQRITSAPRHLLGRA